MVYSFLAFRNNTAVNVCIQVFVQTYAFSFLGYAHRRGIAGSYINCVLTFEELPDCFPEWPYQFIILSTLHEVSSFCISLPAFVIICLSGYVHPYGCAVVSCFFFFFSFWPHGVACGPSLLTRDQTCIPCRGSSVS